MSRIKKNSNVSEADIQPKKESQNQRKTELIDIVTKKLKTEENSKPEALNNNKKEIYDVAPEDEL